MEHMIYSRAKEQAQSIELVASNFGQILHLACSVAPGKNSTSRRVHLVCTHGLSAQDRHMVWLVRTSCYNNGIPSGPSGLVSFIVASIPTA